VASDGGGRDLSEMASDGGKFELIEVAPNRDTWSVWIYNPASPGTNNRPKRVKTNGAINAAVSELVRLMTNINLSKLLIWKITVYVNKQKSLLKKPLQQIRAT
jgi:hypothetical protein